jgi:hypothetical protein
MDKLESCAKEIIRWLRRKNLASDVCVYVPNKCFCIDSLGKITILTGLRASDYFSFANDDSLNMSFEGPLYNALNGYLNRFKISPWDQLGRILKKYDLCAERGDSWNLVTYNSEDTQKDED